MLRKKQRKKNLNLFASVASILEYELLGYIHKKKWMPKPSFSNEHSGNKKSIKKRIDILYNWFKGNYTLQDLERIYKKYNYEIQEF